MNHSELKEKALSDPNVKAAYDEMAPEFLLPRQILKAKQTAGLSKLKHSLPPFLDGVVSPETYERWLKRKAAAHVRRDRRRGHTCSGAEYREAIHAAVVISDGKDSYTGESLDWHLISTYRNEDSKSGRHAYKAGFALLPTVDHVAADATEASFKICSWRTNDAKNDMSIDAFQELCIKVLKHANFQVLSSGN